MKRLITPLAVGAAAFALGISVERYFLHDSTESVAGPQAEERALRERGTVAASRRDESRDGQPEASVSVDLASLRKLAGRSDGESRDARRLLERATREQILQLAAGLGTLDSNDPGDRGLKMEILRRLADHDPKAALAAVLAEDNFQVQSDVIHHVFRQLARQDLANAKLVATTLDNRALRREAIRAIAYGAGEDDPAGVARFLETLEDGREYGDFFEHWAGRNPAEASGFIGTVKDEWKRLDWTGRIARGWARGADPEAAVAWARSLGSSRERAEAVLNIAQTMAESAPAGAALLLDDLPADHTRRQFVEHLARNWAEQDLGGALQWAESLGGALRSQAIEALLPHWVRTDASSAAAYVEALPSSERHLGSLQRVGETWARIDKDAALAWAESQANPAARGRALSGIARSWAREDPQAAAAMASLLEPSDERLQILDEVARSWSGENLDLALGWIQELPPLEQNRAFRGLLDNVTEFDPAQAAALYTNLLASSQADPRGPDGYGGMAGHIAEQWSEFDPASAAGWALSIPDGNTRRHAVERVADRWLRADPLEASRWIGQLDAGDARDAAAERLVDQISGSDPDAALQWALTAQDEGRQTQMLRHVYERWQKSDSQAAEQSFSAVPVSTQQREELQGIFRREIGSGEGK